MAFRYITETVNKNGSKETVVSEIDKQEVLLGRGTSSDVLLTGRLVSLRHALITVTERALIIQDLDSLSGVRVNDSLVTRSELRLGDKVKIGSYSFEVIKEDDVWGFREHREGAAGEEDVEALIERQVKKLRFQSYLPSFTTLSVVICLLLLVVFFVGPLSGINTHAWDSGPISNAHKMIENDCAQCHATPFKRVRDEQCTACHNMSEHALSLPALVENHPRLDYRCASCHMEHNGDHGLIARDVKLCADCHGNLDRLLPATGVPVIPSWDSHPEFRVSLPQPITAEAIVAAMAEGRKAPQPALKKVALDSPELQDTTQLKLNHRVHLEPDIAGRDGLVTLQCMDCHELSSDLKDLKPISFDAHCADCHTLEFDARLPGETVPHGEPSVVFNYLYARYAQLSLQGEGEQAESAGPVRRLPGRAAPRSQEELAFTQASVAEQARTAEEEIFTRTACHLCHMVEEVAQADSTQNRYVVIPPNVPEKWMPQSTFDHGAHQEISCESCHRSVRASEKTSDVLLPRKENCYQCHAEQRTRGMITSQCSMCHSYHESLVMDEKQKREIEQILMSIDEPQDPA